MMATGPKGPSCPSGPGGSAAGRRRAPLVVPPVDDGHMATNTCGLFCLALIVPYPALVFWLSPEYNLALSSGRRRGASGSLLASALLDQPVEVPQHPGAIQVQPGDTAGRL